MQQGELIAAFLSSIATGAAAGKTATVRVIFQTHPGKHGTVARRGISGAKYVLTINGKSHAGSTAADGSVDITYPDNAQVTLTIFDTVYKLTAVGTMEPVASLKGRQQRAIFLGYHAGTVDGKEGPKTDRALLNFQADQGLAPTQQGGLNSGTGNRLVAEFGK